MARPSREMGPDIISDKCRGRGKGVKRPHPTILNGIEGTSFDISSDYMCPVCLDLITEAHMTNCGHTFCRTCLQKSIEVNRRCPKCTVMIYSSENIFPNHLVNQQIQKYRHTLELKKSFKRKNKMSAINELKNYISSDMSCLAESDLEEMITALQEKKGQLNSKSEITKYELLKSFLSELCRRKGEQLASLQREIKLINEDLESVKSNLAVIENQEKNKTESVNQQSSSVPNSGHLTLMDIINTENSNLSDSLSDVKSSSDEGFNVPYCNYNNPESTSLSSKKKRMRLHFEELSEFYFTLRVPSIDEVCEDNSALHKFGNCMTKFTQYSSMRPLATIDAGDRNPASNNIASSIEFDKDSEYFAVAGLTKKIRLFDYSNVIRDAVDIHYPCGEMLCDSKISCVSWSTYQKNLLVSSDYDGTVTVWDAFSAQKKHVFQEHQKRCWSVDFNKMDTKLIASGSDDSRVKLWHLDKERSVYSLEAKANVCCVQFNPCSMFHLAFGSADHCVHYYDLRNMKEALKIFKGHRKAVSYVKFISSEDLVSASTDSQLKIWNVNDSHCVQSLHGHINEKNFVGLATDGDYVACGSENNALYVYYKELPKKLFSFRFDHRRLFLDHEQQKDEESNDFVSAVCWRKGSDIVAAGNSQGVIKILQMNSNARLPREWFESGEEKRKEAGQQSGGSIKEGKSRILYGISDEFPIVSLVGLGKQDSCVNDIEEFDENKEKIRNAIAAGCRALKEANVTEISVDPCGDGSAAAEAATLSLFTYEDLKSKKKPTPLVKCFDPSDQRWSKGLALAEGQNLARRLMEAPANIMTPTNFAQEAVNSLEKLGVEINVRTKNWAQERNMNAFLSVAKGSAEPPIFLEINYKGDDSARKPLAIVGKGVTFDAGGISLKPASKMDLMRGDMGGAACTVGSIFAAAKLNFPINIRGFVPLCENLPSGTAIKPGDVVVASNGKSIQIDNTDAEGRLILADALHYASQHNPRVILDMATLTGAMAVALGAGATGVFSTSASLFNLLHKAGYDTGDRVWRMPLWNVYSKQVTEFGMADVHNLGKHSRMAGASLAAAFLQQFVSCDHWMHLDIAGVMENSDEVAYLGKGMSGRPTRTVAEFAYLLSKATEF